MTEPRTTPAAPAPPAPHPVPGLPLATAELGALASALASRPALWAPHLSHAPDHRTHLRLAATARWEAWLISWPSGHGVEMHDHGDAAGAVAVLEGELVELVARRSTGTLAPRALATGTVRRVPPGRVHDVLNRGAAPAASIHVYSPALRTMTFYDDSLRPTRTEVVYPEAPVLGADAVARALGPA